MLTERDNGFCKSAGGNDRGMIAKFFPNPVNHAVNAGGIAVQDAALHAVNGICAYYFWRSIQ